jgi:putative membrane protein
MLKKYAAAAAVVLLAACGGHDENTSGTPETETTASSGQSIQETSSATATTTGATGGSMSAMMPEEKEFVSDAGMDGMFDVQAGNLALQKAQSADVKSFAQRMVNDHGTSNAELAQFATTKGLALPTELGGEMKGAFDHLNGLTGAEFDKAYMHHMVEGHDKDVAEFDKMSTSASDSDLKAWAGKTLPTLKQHQQMAKDIASKLK